MTEVESGNIYLNEFWGSLSMREAFIGTDEDFYTFIQCHCSLLSNTEKPQTQKSASCIDTWPRKNYQPICQEHRAPDGLIVLTRSQKFAPFVSELGD